MIMGLVQALWGLSNPNAFETAEWKGKRIRVEVVIDKGRQRANINGLLADEGRITLSTRMVLNYGINDEIKFRDKLYVITAIDDSNNEVAPQNTAQVSATYLQGIRLNLFEVNQKTRNLHVNKPVISVANNKATIACATLDAEIFYTIDGTVPSSLSTLYKGEFDVSTVDKVFAIALHENRQPSKLVVWSKTL